MDDQENEFLSRCLQRLLLPVMKFCLRRSLKLQEIVEAVKGSLVEAAQSEMERLGEKATTNRLSVMTGIHRADVARLASGAGAKSEKTSANIINRLIAQWQTDPRFLNSAKRPRVLSFDGKEGEFAELVRSVSSDPNPYSVLFELERIAAAEVSARGIKLRTPEYIVSSDIQRSFDHLSQDSEDLISAVEENIFTNGSDPNLHLRTEYDNVDQNAIPGIRRWILREGSSFHRRLREFLGKQDKDVNKRLKDRTAGVRVSICSFSRVEAKTKGVKR